MLIVIDKFLDIRDLYLLICTSRKQRSLWDPVVRRRGILYKLFYTPKVLIRNTNPFLVWEYLSQLCQIHGTNFIATKMIPILLARSDIDIVWYAAQFSDKIYSDRNLTISVAKYIPRKHLCELTKLVHRDFTLLYEIINIYKDICWLDAEFDIILSYIDRTVKMLCREKICDDNDFRQIMYGLYILNMCKATAVLVSYDIIALSRNDPKILSKYFPRILKYAWPVAAPYHNPNVGGPYIGPGLPYIIDQLERKKLYQNWIAEYRSL